MKNHIESFLNNFNKIHLLFKFSIIYSAFLFFPQDLVLGKVKDYNILDYGAKSNCNTLNHIYIQAAIDDAYKNGGGKVIVPPGIFLTGSFYLKSNVELQIDKGAVLVGSTDISDYKNIDDWKALILAENQSKIKITGDGIIDGQGRSLALKIDSLFYAGKLDSIYYNKNRKRPNEHIRPELIKFYKCDSIEIKNINLKNSSCWVQTYQLCSNLKIDNIKVISDAYWNNDGLDIVDCKNVHVFNCYINSADDGICLKSEDSSALNENIVIENNTIRSSASAVKFGTASSGGFKNITIKNIKVFDTFRSAIALESVDGGILEDVYIKNITAYNTRNAVFIKLGHRNVDGKIGTLKNIVIKDIKVHIPFNVPDLNYEIRGPELSFIHNPFPASITGLPENFIENVTLENFEIVYPGKGNNGLANLPLFKLKDVPENEKEYPEFHMFGELPSWAFYIRHVKNLTMKNFIIVAENPDYRPAFVFDDVEKLNLEKIDILEDEIDKHQIILFNVKDYFIDDKLEKELFIIK